MLASNTKRTRSPEWKTVVDGSTSVSPLSSSRTMRYRRPVLTARPAESDGAVNSALALVPAGAAICAVAPGAASVLAGTASRTVFGGSTAGRSFADEGGAPGSTLDGFAASTGAGGGAGAGAFAGVAADQTAAATNAAAATRLTAIHVARDCGAGDATVDGVSTRTADTVTAPVSGGTSAPPRTSSANAATAARIASAVSYRSAGSFAIARAMMRSISGWFRVHGTSIGGGGSDITRRMTAPTLSFCGSIVRRSA